MCRWRVDMLTDVVAMRLASIFQLKTLPLVGALGGSVG